MLQSGAFLTMAHAERSIIGIDKYNTIQYKGEGSKHDVKNRIKAGWLKWKVFSRCLAGVAKKSQRKGIQDND